MTRKRATATGTECALSLLALLPIAAPALPARADEAAREALAATADGQPDAAAASASTRRDPDITTFPHYPDLARLERIEGEATVCFKVAPDGRVLEAAVASSTHEIFEEPALQAIEASSFEPLAKGEELVPTLCRTYRFRLESVVDS